MQAVLEDFLKAVRSHDITVSSAESIEAGHTFELIGFENREILKYALSATLAKNLEERESFSKCFDGFFSFESFKERNEHAEEEVNLLLRCGSSAAGGRASKIRERAREILVEAKEGGNSQRRC